MPTEPEEILDELEDEGQEEEGQEEEKQESRFMTAEQMQQMLDRQAEMFAQRFQPPAPQQQQQVQEEPIQAPSHAQMKQALEEGDWDRYMELQAQREQAIYQATMREGNRALSQLRNEGSSFIQQTNKQLLKQAVPDYERYSKEVTELAGQLGLDPVAQTNPEIVSLLTSTVRGRPENMEKEFQTWYEQRRRKANGPGTTSDVSSAGRNHPGAYRSEDSVFTNEGMAALQSVGKTNEEFARKLGYANWAEYESQAARVMSEDVVVHKWKRPKGGR